MIAGIIIVLGASIMLMFRNDAVEIVDTASNQLTKANGEMNA